MVLAILKSNSHTEPQKEIALRRIPEVWNYLASNILPSMRYADIEFDYGVDEFVTRTTVEPQSKPSEPEKQPETTTQPQPIVVEEEMGIIIATPNHDSNDDKRQHHKDKKDEKARIIGEYESISW